MSSSAGTGLGSETSGHPPTRPNGGGWTGRGVVGIGACVLGLVLVCAVCILASDATRSGLIEDGLSVGSVDVGGMRPRAAQTELERRLSERFAQPITVVALGRQFRLLPAQAGLALDTAAMVKSAQAKTRSDSPLARTFTGLFGGHTSLPAAVTYSSQTVDSFIESVRRSIDIPARSATIVPFTDHLEVTPSTDGQAVDTRFLRSRLESELVGPSVQRTLQLPVQPTRPEVTTQALPGKYPFYITVDRANFQLHLFDHLAPSKTYQIAVGQAGLETPVGVYDIKTKAVDPAWYVPNRPWAGDMAGKTIPPNAPNNPIKARWMGLGADGVGIHGTDETNSLGTAGSHGCIRMAVGEVIQLFNQIPLHTPVFVG